MMTLDEWYAEYKRLAEERGVGWICTGNPADYQGFYDDGDSPDDALDTELSYVD